LDPDGTVTRLLDNLAKPNGILVTPDSRTLYVSDRGTQKLRRYALTPDGSVKPKDVVYDFSPDRGIDGMWLDVEGNIYGAAGKGGPSMLADQNLTTVAGKLHQNRFAEAYVSADQLFNAFGPFAQMLGMIDAFEPLPAMKPVGLSARGDGGGVLLRVFVPGDVIGFAAEFAQTMEMDDMPAGGEGEPMEPDF